MSFSWDEAVAYALTLPDTEISTSYGMPAIKVNGRTFLGTRPVRSASRSIATQSPC